MNNITSFYLAGLQFRPIENIDKIQQGMVLNLVAEPDNQYDENAIKVLLQDGTHIGYVPKKQTVELHPYRIVGIPLFTVLAHYTPEMPTYRRCLITIKSKEDLPKYIDLPKYNLESKQLEEFKNFINLKQIDE